MNHHFVFGNVNEALPELSRNLLQLGDEVGSRLGERTMELTQVGIKLERPWQREIMLPTRKANLAAQVAETMWVLSGRNDIGWLSHYLPRAADFSDDGSTWRSGYGPRLRSSDGIDQLARAVELLQISPGTRQAVISIWNPKVDGTPGKDTACNDLLQFLSRKGKLDLHVFIRSNDLVWGLSGINQFEWSALLEIVAGMTGLMVGQLHFSIGSLHVYDRHWEKARQLAGTWTFALKDSPRFNATGIDDMSSFDYCADMWFKLEALIRTGQPVGTQVDEFPEPMLQSWLRVLQWYWSGDSIHMQLLAGTNLFHAAVVGTKPAGEPLQMTLDDVFNVSVRAETDREVDLLLDELPSCTSCGGTGTVYGSEDTECPTCIGSGDKPSFLEFVNALHAEKHAAYGDSWKRRGEPGILGNIARKVDRLGAGSSTADETPFDTALDLMVYLAKYLCWLDGYSGDPATVERVLVRVATERDLPDHVDPEVLVEGFRFLESLADDGKYHVVETMLDQAYVLALSRY